jgi:hypothetical protein
MRPSNQDLITTLYVSISSLWSSATAVDIVHCFRVIINAGQDPDASSSEHVDWKGDGTKVQVIDKILILELLRRSNVLDILISKFNESIDIFSNAMEEYKVLLLSESSMNEINTHRSEDSDVAPAVAEESSVYRSDEELQQMKAQLQHKRKVMEALLKFCLDLSHDAKSASQMFHAGICNGCLVILRDIALHDSPRNPRMAELVQLLWVCLESHRNENASGLQQIDEDQESVLDVELSMQVLKDLLMLLIGEGYRLIDKECRNEVVIVISLILSIFPDITVPNMIAYGLLDVIVSLACIGESSKDAWGYFLPNLKLRNFSSASESDLEFKRLLWMVLSQMMMSGDRDVMVCVASSPILETMLIYLEFDPTDTPSRDHHQTSSNAHLTTSSSFSPNVSLVFQRNSYQSSSHVIIKNPKSLSFESSSEMIESSFIPRTEESVRSSVDNDGFNPGDPSMTMLQSSKLPATKASVLSTLPISQLRQFQVLASNILVNYAAILIREFNRIDGPQRVLTTIERLSRSYDNHDLISYLLMILSRCVVNSKLTKQYLEDHQAVQRIVSLFNHFHQYNLQKSNAAIEEMNIQCIRLIGLLCEGDPSCQQQLQKNHGIELLIESLAIYNKDRKPSIGIASKALVLQDIYTGAATTAAAIMTATSNKAKTHDTTKPTDINALVIAVVDCIRTGIVGNAANETAFVLAEGIDALLDTLEVLSYQMRVQVYRLLSDLLHNHQLLSFFKAWRSSKTMRSSVQLFCHGWLDEEIRLGSVSERGILANLSNPLANQTWPTDISIDYARESLSSTSIAVSEVPAMPIAVSRLTNAIATANSFMQTQGQVQNSSLEILQFQEFEEENREIFRQAMLVDTRGIIASILNQMDDASSSAVSDSILADDPASNFDHPIVISSGDMSLTTHDRKVLAIARKYSYFRASEWWDAVNETAVMSSDGQTILRPIAEDMAIIQDEKDRIFDAVLSVQMEQMALDQEQGELDDQQINAFHDHILDIKNQQIKSEWLKKNAKKKRYQITSSSRLTTAQ